MPAGEEYFSVSQDILKSAEDLCSYCQIDKIGRDIVISYGMIALVKRYSVS